jgi:hypothetical protein
MYILAIFCIYLCGVIASSSECVCTQVECPHIGANVVVMGEGGSTITYVYEKHMNYTVVISASGIVYPLSLDNGSETTSCTQKYARMLEDDGKQDCDAGHILANRLGGYGNTPINIFPQDATINRGEYAQFEGDIYNCLYQNTEYAYLEWVFYYESNNRTMPNKVKYSAEFTNSDCDDLYSIFTN